MADTATITYWDARGKRTGISVNTAELSGANFDVQVTAMDALRTAIDTISLSAQSQQIISSGVLNGAPADRGGFRGTKALIRWFAAGEGTDGQYGSNEIGAVDPSLFTVVGSQALLQGTPYNALKAAFDAFATTENGNSVSVYEVELVSRTL